MEIEKKGISSTKERGSRKPETTEKCASGQKRCALVIGANEEAVFSMETARKYGLRVAAMDGNPKAAGLAAADEAYHLDINDLASVFAVCDRLEPLVVMPAPIGHCLTTVGAVNDRYHLAGVSQSAAEICTDKYLFHRKMKEQGLRDAQLVLLSGGKAVQEEDIAPLTGYPVVVKPRLGSGSRNVEICGNAQELLCFLKYEVAENGVLTEDYVAETCIPGPEYGVDGAYVDGRFRMVLLRRKKNTPPPYRQCVGYYSVLPGEEPAFYENCCRLMQEMGEAIGFENCVVHADLIRRRGENGELTDIPFVIETSARPSGHNLSNLFTPLAGGVTLVEDFLKLALLMKQDSGSLPDGESLWKKEQEEEREKLFVPKTVRKLLIRYFDLPEGIVRRVPDPELLAGKYPLLDYSCRILPGEELSLVRDGASVMGRGYYILEGKDDRELDELDAGIRSEFVIEQKEESV